MGLRGSKYVRFLKYRRPISTYFYTGNERPQCAAVMDAYWYHLLYCERGPHRIWQHVAQVKLLARDLTKSCTSHRCRGRAGRTSQGKTRYPRTWQKRRNGAFRCYDLQPSQPGKDPDCVCKSNKSFKGSMDCQIFQILGRPEHGSTCYLLLCQPSVVGTRTLIGRYALPQRPLRQRVCPHFDALEDSCSSATRLHL